jgi:hypothetical protein
MAASPNVGGTINSAFATFGRACYAHGPTHAATTRTTNAPPITDPMTTR